MTNVEIEKITNVVPMRANITTGTYAKCNIELRYNVCYEHLQYKVAEYMLWLLPPAIYCNKFTNYDLLLFDYVSYLNDMMSIDASYNSIFNDVTLPAALHIDTIRRLNARKLSLDAVQTIINDNISAFAKLNTYVAEQKLIKQINSI